MRIKRRRMLGEGHGWASSIPCAMVEDSGLTEFHGVVTRTCCAVGPAAPEVAAPEVIDIITGHPKLL
jgi:PTH2 family peptidyl-tRNA hydrolase